MDSELTLRNGMNGSLYACEPLYLNLTKKASFDVHNQQGRFSYSPTQRHESSEKA